MSSLYRSQTMSYVRLLLTEDSAVVTIRALGSWGHLHIVDLNAANAAAALSERVGRLKKRIALCQYWEKRLQSLRDLMPEYGVEPLLEDEVSVSAAVEAAAGDVLEAVSGAVEPLEASLSKNIVFRREQTLAVSSMTEQLHVLSTIIDPQGTSRRQRADEEKQPGYSAQTAGARPLSPLCLHQLTRWRCLSAVRVRVVAAAVFMLTTAASRVRHQRCCQHTLSTPLPAQRRRRLCADRSRSAVGC